ncbi:hypothetical protein ACP3TC_04650 [Winslowiella sp. 2C04]
MKFDRTDRQNRSWLSTAYRHSPQGLLTTRKKTVQYGGQQEGKPGM